MGLYLSGRFFVGLYTGMALYTGRGGGLYTGVSEALELWLICSFFSQITMYFNDFWATWAYTRGSLFSELYGSFGISCHFAKIVLEALDTLETLESHLNLQYFWDRIRVFGIFGILIESFESQRSL